MSGDRKIRPASKLGYAVGQVAEGLKNTSFSLLVLFFYNQVLGLSGTWCGAALGIALLFDAVTDPLVGSLSDRMRSRLGRRHPFIWAAGPPLAITFYFLFSPPDLSDTGLFIWLLVWSILTRAAMTLFHVPHMALGAELTENFVERTSIVAYRLAFGYLGAVLTAGLAFGIFFSDAAGGRLNRPAYSSYAICVAVLMWATVWLSAWQTQREIPFLPRPTHTGATGNFVTQVFSELRNASRNDSFRWLFAGVLVVFVMVGVDGALGLYVSEYFWELSGQQILVLLISSPLGLICGAPFTQAIHRRYDKRPALVFGTGGWAVLQVVPIVLRLLDLFPANGTSSLFIALVSFKFVQGMVVQQALVSFSSMMADVADEHELQSGLRQEGIFFGAVAFSGKGASGLGSLASGIALDLIAWPSGKEIEGLSQIPSETLFKLGLVYGPIVSGFAVISVWCYMKYRLDRERHREVLEGLAATRTSAATAVRGV